MVGHCLGIYRPVRQHPGKGGGKLRSGRGRRSRKLLEMERNKGGEGGGGPTEVPTVAPNYNFSFSTPSVFEKRKLGVEKRECTLGPP